MLYLSTTLIVALSTLSNVYGYTTAALADQITNLPGNYIILYLFFNELLLIYNYNI
jgi:hypothetical protein